MGSHVFSRRSRPVISDQRCEGDLTRVIELPAENVQRWTALREAAVVNAVDAGVLTREEICRRYQISLEELLSWERAYEGGAPSETWDSGKTHLIGGQFLRPASSPVTPSRD
jgi:hypothetical protein